MKNIIKKNEHFIKFLFVGGTSTLIDFIIYMIISSFIGISLSKIISMIIASIYSFFMNRGWTFGSNDKSIWTKVLFIGVVVINITVNTLTNNLFFYITNNKIISFIVATFIAMIVNFLLQKKLFTKKN